MTSIKHRLTKLEANAPAPAEDRITEIHRVMVDRKNPSVPLKVIVRLI